MNSLPIADSLPLGDPLYSQKNPHQTFLLLFSLYAAAPLLMGRSTGSTALQDYLNHPTIILWGLCLLVGSGLALLGSFWPGRTWTGLVLERTGVGLVGLGAMVYATVVYFTVETDARYVVGVTAAYGLSCIWRVAQITRRLHWIRVLIHESNRALDERADDADG